MGSSFNYKWIVRIKRGLFMAGTHRFKTKREAENFLYRWNHVPENHRDCVYADLPYVEKAKGE